MYIKKCRRKSIQTIEVNKLKTLALFKLLISVPTEGLNITCECQQCQWNWEKQTDDWNLLVIKWRQWLNKISPSLGRARHTFFLSSRSKSNMTFEVLRINIQTPFNLGQSLTGADLIILHLPLEWSKHVLAHLHNDELKLILADAIGSRNSLAHQHPII